LVLEGVIEEVLVEVSSIEEACRIGSEETALSWIIEAAAKIDEVLGVSLGTIGPGCDGRACFEDVPKLVETRA